MIDLNVKFLKAALLTAGVKDIRYYLNAVYVEVQGGTVRIVSTDGAHASCLTQSESVDVLDFSVLIPRDIVSMLPKTDVATLRRITDEEWGLGAISFKPVVAKYPEWQRVFPDEASGEVAYYPAESHALFLKVAKVLGKKEALIGQSGDLVGHVRVIDAPEYRGACAPLRASWVEKHLK